MFSRETDAQVVLLHGNGGLAQEILSAFLAIARICWIAPDGPGYGNSDRLPEKAPQIVIQTVLRRPVTLLRLLTVQEILGCAKLRNGGAEKTVATNPCCIV